MKVKIDDGGYMPKRAHDVDDHWISVTFCHECKHLKWEMMSSGCRVSSCSKLKVPVTTTFWCAFGEKKKR